VLHYNIFLWWESWIFSIITPHFSVTQSFWNHSNLLIWCSKNISYYYQCWEQLWSFLWKPLIVWQSERGVRGCTGTFTVGLLLTVFSCREKHNALIDKRLQINLDMTQSLKLAFKLCSFITKLTIKLFWHSCVVTDCCCRLSSSEAGVHVNWSSQCP